MQLITQRLEYLYAFEKCLDFISLNASEMQKLQTCVCFTHPLYTKCESGCVFAETKPQSIRTTALEWS